MTTNCLIPPEESLIEYPCSFPIKVMGLTHPEFQDAIVKALTEHVPDFDESHIQQALSSSGKYTSLRINVYVTSREQLDNIYRMLTSHPMVKVVL